MKILLIFFLIAINLFISSCSSNRFIFEYKKIKKVHYIELNPQEFRQRIKEAPIAYLPMGTLEWHGEHLPLGADGIQPDGLFTTLAGRVGGIVLPMLFTGPDKTKIIDNEVLYGMDFHKAETPQQLDGSAYWIEQEPFITLFEAILKQLKRAGFLILMAYGHGPSNKIFNKNRQEWSKELGLHLFSVNDGLESPDPTKEKCFQCDHAAKSETSIMMALRPDLVKMENLPEDTNIKLTGVSGIDPRLEASKEVGEKIISFQVNRWEKKLKEMLEQISKD